MSSIPCPYSRFSICILGSGFLWTGNTRTVRLGDNPGSGLPWLGNILSGIFGNPGYAPAYGGYPGYYHPGPCWWYHHWWYHPYPTWQQGQTSNIQIYGSGNTVGVTQSKGQNGGY